MYTCQLKDLFAHYFGEDLSLWKGAISWAVGTRCQWHGSLSTTRFIHRWYVSSSQLRTMFCRKISKDACCVTSTVKDNSRSPPKLFRFWFWGIKIDVVGSLLCARSEKGRSELNIIKFALNENKSPRILTWPQTVLNTPESISTRIPSNATQFHVEEQCLLSTVVCCLLNCLNLVAAR